jgi:hypothetical protein
MIQDGPTWTTGLQRRVKWDDLRSWDHLTATQLTQAQAGIRIWYHSILAFNHITGCTSTPAPVIPTRIQAFSLNLFSSLINARKTCIFSTASFWDQGCTRAGRLRDITGHTLDFSRGIVSRSVLTRICPNMQALIQTDLDLPLSSTQDIISASQKAPEFSLTQNAASMAMRSSIFQIGWPPIDKILGGGISRGNILEISGPPGCYKDCVAMGSVISFINADEEVLFMGIYHKLCVVCPSHPNPRLSKYGRTFLPSWITKLYASHIRNRFEYSFVDIERENLDDGLKLVTHLSVQNLVDLLSFLNQLPEYIRRRPNVCLNHLLKGILNRTSSKTGLLVINSISFPLQFLNKYPTNTRNSVLEQVKQAFTKACAVNFLTVLCLLLLI